MIKPLLVLARTNKQMLPAQKDIISVTLFETYPQSRSIVFLLLISGTVWEALLGNIVIAAYVHIFFFQ